VSQVSPSPPPRGVQTMMELGDKLTEEECTLFVRLIDDNNDGIVQWSEFLEALKTGGTMFSYGEEPATAMSPGRERVPLPDVGALSLSDEKSAQPSPVMFPEATFTPLSFYPALVTPPSLATQRDKGEGRDIAHLDLATPSAVTVVESVPENSTV
jgi:hypothetical protein